MHFEILIEDKSGEELISIVLPKIIDLTKNTYKTHSYKGIGRLPHNLKKSLNPQKRQLLSQLHRLLAGFGKTINSRKNYPTSVIVLIDNDKNDCKKFRQEIYSLWDNIYPRPPGKLCLMIEEAEAWLLGDRNAVLKAYPQAKNNIIDSYQQDSLCDTWELLADAIQPGGFATLKHKVYYEKGKCKIEWARNIAPHIDISANQSKSFQYFVKSVQEFAD